MRRELARARCRRRTPRCPPGVALRPLRREDLPAAAEIIYRSHVGSVDAALNLTYATPATCRAFVDTLVVRSGCGQFDPEASRLAEGPWGPLGVLIASRLVARERARLPGLGRPRGAGPRARGGARHHGARAPSASRASRARRCR